MPPAIVVAITVSGGNTCFESPSKCDPRQRTASVHFLQALHVIPRVQHAGRERRDRERAAREQTDQGVLAVDGDQPGDGGCDQQRVDVEHQPVVHEVAAHRHHVERVHGRAERGQQDEAPDFRGFREPKARRHQAEYTRTPAGCRRDRPGGSAIRSRPPGGPRPSRNTYWAGARRSTRAFRSAAAASARPLARRAGPLRPDAQPGGPLCRPRANGCQSVTTAASTTQGAPSSRVATSAMLSAAKIARSRQRARRCEEAPPAPARGRAARRRRSPSRCPRSRRSRRGGSARAGRARAGDASRAAAARDSRTTSQATATVLTRYEPTPRIRVPATGSMPKRRKPAANKVQSKFV